MSLFSNGFPIWKQKMPLMPYSYQYAVNDNPSNLNFGQIENSDGAKVTGMYYVLLPDGRTQKVIYTADANGYVADVSYEGNAMYPQQQTAPQTYGQQISIASTQDQTAQQIGPSQAAYGVPVQTSSVQVGGTAYGPVQTPVQAAPPQVYSQSAYGTSSQVASAVAQTSAPIQVTSSSASTSSLASTLIQTAPVSVQVGSPANGTPVAQTVQSVAPQISGISTQATPTLSQIVSAPVQIAANAGASVQAAQVPVSTVPVTAQVASTTVKTIPVSTSTTAPTTTTAPAQVTSTSGAPLQTTTSSAPAVVTTSAPATTSNLNISSSGIQIAATVPTTAAPVSTRSPITPVLVQQTAPLPSSSSSSSTPATNSTISVQVTPVQIKQVTPAPVLTNATTVPQQQQQQTWPTVKPLQVPAAPVVAQTPSVVPATSAPDTTRPPTLISASQALLAQITPAAQTNSAQAVAYPSYGQSLGSPVPVPTYAAPAPSPAAAPLLPIPLLPRNGSCSDLPPISYSG